MGVVGRHDRIPHVQLVRPADERRDVSVRGPFAQIVSVDVQAFPDSGIAIAWSARSGSTTAPPRAYVQKFTGLAGFTNLQGAQTDLHLTTLPANAMIAAWIQASPDNTTYSIAMQRFDVMLKAIGTEQLLTTLPLTGRGPADLTIASMADGTTVIAWAQDSAVFWQIVDAGGTPVGSVHTVSVNGSMLVDTVKAVPRASGFTLIAESTSSSNRGTTGTIDVFTIDASGASQASSDLGQRTLWSVSPTTGDSCGPSPAGVAAGGGTDGRYVIAYESCSGPQASQLQVLAP